MTYIGLGSNVGDRLSMLRAAVAALDAVRRVSSVYETVAVGPPQPDYMNAVVEIETSLRPRALLARLQTIERDLGRVERERWGPREIDLDILVAGEVVSEPGLRIPHPELGSRAFVLVPLAELAPTLQIPGLGVVSELLERVERSGVRLAFAPDAIAP